MQLAWATSGCRSSIDGRLRSQRQTFRHVVDSSKHATHVSLLCLAVCIAEGGCLPVATVVERHLADGALALLLLRATVAWDAAAALCALPVCLSRLMAIIDLVGALAHAVQLTGFC